MRRPRPGALSPLEQDFDLEAWVRARMPVIRARGAEFWVACPACNRPRLVVNVVRKAYRCLGCPVGFAGWSPYDLVQAVVGSVQVDIDIVQYVRGRSGPVPLLPSEGEGQRRRAFPEIEMPFRAQRGLGRRQAQYLEERQIPWEHAQLFDLWSYPTLLPRGPAEKIDYILKGRVIVPVKDLDRRVVSWAARATDTSARSKVINHPLPCEEPQNHHADCTCRHEDWGLPLAPGCAGTSEALLGVEHLLPQGDAYLVEGVTDVLTCGPGFVAALGDSIQPYQVALLARAGVRRVYLMADGDAAGAAFEKKARALLAPVVTTVVVRLPQGEDPGSLGRKSCLDIAKRSRDHSDIPVL